MLVVKSSLIYFLLTSFVLVLVGCAEKESTEEKAKRTYKEWVKKEFDVAGDKVFLIPLTGCKPCLKQGANFLTDKLPDVTSTSSVVVITSDSLVYERLSSVKGSNAKIVFDRKRILDTHFEVDISNMTFLDFTTEEFRPVFTHPGFNYSKISIN